MFHSEILSPWSDLTFSNGLPGIGRQLCIKMWFWQFSTHKIYVRVCGKISEPYFDALICSKRLIRLSKRLKIPISSYVCILNEKNMSVGLLLSFLVLWLWWFSTVKMTTTKIIFTKQRKPSYFYIGEYFQE